MEHVISVPLASSDSRDKSPWHRLGGLLQKQLKDLRYKQAALARATRISSSEISQLKNGKSCMSAGALLKIAGELELDETLVLLLREEGRALKDAADSPQFTEYAQVICQAATTRWSEVLRAQEGLAGGCLTLSALGTMHLDVLTVLVGDRREDPPMCAADLLALPASLDDAGLLPTLGLSRSCRVRTDRFGQLASLDVLTRLTEGDALILGAPSVNLQARLANRSSFFPFVIDESALREEEGFAKIVSELGRDRTVLNSWKKNNGKRILNLLKEFSNHGFYDPIQDEILGSHEPQDIHYGTISFAEHPWPKAGRRDVSILVAGRTREASLAGLKLLADPERSFHKRPLGGVFSVLVNLELGAERTDWLTPSWKTPEYKISDISRRLDVASLYGEGSLRRQELLARLQARGGTRRNEPVSHDRQ